MGSRTLLTHSCACDLPCPIFVACCGSLATKVKAVVAEGLARLTRLGTHIVVRQQLTPFETSVGKARKGGRIAVCASTTNRQHHNNTQACTSTGRFNTTCGFGFGVLHPLALPPQHLRMFSTSNISLAPMLYLPLLPPLHSNPQLWSEHQALSLPPLSAMRPLPKSSTVKVS